MSIGRINFGNINDNLECTSIIPIHVNELHHLFDFSLQQNAYQLLQFPIDRTKVIPMHDYHGYQQRIVLQMNVDLVVVIVLSLVEILPIWNPIQPVLVAKLLWSKSSPKEENIRSINCCVCTSFSFFSLSIQSNTMIFIYKQRIFQLNSNLTLIDQNLATSKPWNKEFQISEN